MNTHEGYSKKTISNANVLLAGGGDKSLADFLGGIRISASKIQYKTADAAATWTDLITLVNTDENVKLTPKTDNVNRPLMMINGGTSTGELTNTSMFSTGIYANANTKMITANGFIKTGHDDTSVLLAGGGAKALTDFATSTHNHDNRYVIRTGDSIPGYIESSFANNEEKGFWIALANNSFTIRFTFGSSSHNGGLYSPLLGWWCYLPNGATSNTLAIFTGKASYAGDADTLDSYHANTLFESLTRPSNTNDISIKIGNNTKSITLGSRAWDSTAYLPLAGGDMTGCIRRTYTSASDDPMISLASFDLDVWLWRVNDHYHLTSARYGYGLKYLGTGSGNNNALALYADNSTSETPIQALYMTNNGVIKLSSTPNVNGTNVSLEGHTHTWANITNPPDTATRWPKWSEITNKIVSKTAWGLTYIDTNGDFLSISGDMSNVGTINGHLNIYNTFSTAILNIDCINQSGPAYLHMYVSSSNSDYATSRPLVLQNEYGPVGIGVTNPTYKLEVNGDVKATNFRGALIGNATTATSAGKWTTARTFTIGSTGKSVDGSSNVSWTLSEIGAASSGHTHDDRYLKLTGGTLANSTGGYILTVNNTSGGESGIKLQRAGNTAWGIRVITGNFYLTEVNSGVNALIYKENSLGLTATFAGSVYAPHFYESSDIRLKHDISMLSKSIRKFKFNNDDRSYYGFIAQELETLHPELVDSSGEYKTVNYNSAICYYIAELENKVQKLEDEINKLKNK